MKGWDGDPAFWHAADGALTGESSTANPVKQNTFVIWRGGAPKDFELKVEYRLSADQQRHPDSQRAAAGGPGHRQVGDEGLPGRHRRREPVHRADLRGARARLSRDARPGDLHRERLACRQIIGNLQQTPDELKALIKTGDWNQVHLIARGSTITQILNGAVVSMVVDEDQKNRQLGGLLGFQMHVGPPMKVEFRNIWLKTL